MKKLICLAAGACGVGTFGDITGYFNINGWRYRLPAGPPWTWAKRPGNRRGKPITKRLVSELVEDGRLLKASVEGWKEQTYLYPQAGVGRTVDARGFVTPFDSLVWDRRRMERLFRMKYSIEMYLPPAERVYGYYVCPFLLGDTLVARCDLKADRSCKILIVQSAFLEPGQDGRRVVPDLISELRRLQEWLKLDAIEVSQRGDLAAILRGSVTSAAVHSKAHA